jgi:hypothetical protein
VVPLPVLSSVGGGVRFHANFDLVTVALPALATVGLEQDESISVWQLSHLDSISMPKLLSTPAPVYLTFSGDELPASAAMTIDFGALETVGVKLEIKRRRWNHLAGEGGSRSA